MRNETFLLNHFTGVELLDESEVAYMRPYDCVDFEKHFKFYYNTSLLEYLKNISKEQKFDAIILSNVLHKMEVVDIPFIMESIRYLVAFIISFIFNLIVLYLTLKYFNFNAVLSQIVAAVSYTLMMYILLRLLVFPIKNLSEKILDENF